jgi:hypothetical protein
LKIKKKIVSEKEKSEALHKLHAFLTDLCKVDSEPSSDEEIKVESVAEEKSVSDSERMRRSSSGSNNTNQNSPTTAKVRHMLMLDYLLICVKKSVDIVQTILDQAYENWRVDREKNNFRLLVKKDKKKVSTLICARVTHESDTLLQSTKDFLVSVFNFKGEGQIGASVEQVLEYFRNMPISDWVLLENSVNPDASKKCTTNE